MRTSSTTTGSGRSGMLLGVFMCGAALHASANPIANWDFEAYSNVSATVDTAVSDALPPTWIETGAGGHTFIGDVFGLFEALPDPDGIDDLDPDVNFAAWLTESGEGIYQTVATQPARQYLVETSLGQFIPDITAEGNFSVYNGNSTAPGTQYYSTIFPVDASHFGDGNVTSHYIVGLFTAQSAVTTLQFTLHSFSLGDQGHPDDAGFALDNVRMSEYDTVVPEPGTLGLLAIGATALWYRRRA